MADNVTTQSSTLATIPTSTKISTDEDAANGHVQRVKLAVAADGSSTHIGGDASGLYVQGAAAEDAAAAGNPVLIAGKAKETDGTDPGDVAENDAIALRTDMQGRVLVNTAGPYLFRANDNQAAAQTNTQLQAAPGANLSLYITDVIMSTDTAMNIKIVDDTAGAPADILGPYYFAANGGMALAFRTPIRIDANTDVGYTSSGAGNHSVTISGYIAP